MQIEPEKIIQIVKILERTYAMAKPMTSDYAKGTADQAEATIVAIKAQFPELFKS